MRRWLPWIVLAIVVVCAIGVLVARSQTSDAPEARARRLERQIACPVCTGESVAESSAPESRAIRTDIRDRIARGESDGTIRDAYVRVYGERIRLNPGNGGLAIVAWGLPVAALIAGLAAIAFALRRWSREPRMPATAEDEVLVARAREERA
jgi:cytochrome c-type biogenesis protein CcmH